MIARYIDAEQDSRRFTAGGGAHDGSLKEACRATMRFAQKYNAWVEESDAQQAALLAWQSIVEVAFTRRWVTARERGLIARAGDSERACTADSTCSTTLPLRRASLATLRHGPHP